MTRHLITLAVILASALAWWRPTTVQADTLHCFDQSGYCVSNPVVWDYFTHRGGVNTFGYPISQQFLFEGAQVQFFQRRIIQIEPNGQAGLLNVLDPGLMPYTQFNGATFPAIDPELVASAPPATDQAATIAWIERYVPDIWEGMPVNFFKTFINTVSCDTAYPNGNCQTQFIPGFNLEMWGIPTSLPMVDPNNHNFIYQRFQRGVMMYDAGNGTTQGVLFGQYLKAIITGQGLPSDIAQEACGNGGFGPSILCQQYLPLGYAGLRDPGSLRQTELALAFTPDNTNTVSVLHNQIISLDNCGRELLMELYPMKEWEYGIWQASTGYPWPLTSVCAGRQENLGSFIYVISSIKPNVFLAPGVADALSYYQEYYGPITLPTVPVLTPLPTLTPTPVPPPTPTPAPYPYPRSHG